MNMNFRFVQKTEPKTVKATQNSIMDSDRLRLLHIYATRKKSEDVTDSLLDYWGIQQLIVPET